jgi:carboxyl-terminal processing protease
MVYPLSKAFVENHIGGFEKNAELVDRVSKQFIQKLDPQKIYYLKKDTTKIKSEIKAYLQNPRDQKCQPLEDARAKLLTRITAARSHIDKLVGSKDFKIDESVTINTDRDEVDYPRTEKEATERQEDYIHFQMANYKTTGSSLEEAKEKLKKRHDLQLKRIRKLKGGGIHSLFLDSYANSLDPHSSYLDQDTLEDFEISMSLSLEGIGAVLSWENGFTVVRKLVPGGAAAKSKKIQVGDKILAVEDSETDGMINVVDRELREVVKLIRGKPKSWVKLSILRKGAEPSKKKRIVKITRAKIQLEDEAAKLTMKEHKRGDKTYKLAHIDIPSFYASQDNSRSVTADVKKLLKEVKEKKADGVLLDLSKNGGGALREAVNLAGLFIKKGNIVAMKSSGGDVESLADNDESVEYSGPLAILTSRMTASASEIVAGALQDYGRALVVGSDHTFGKGSVQSVIKVPNKMGALKITSGMYFIPGGKSTQHQGVIPDIVLPDLYFSREIGEKTLDYSLPPQTIDPFLSEKKMTQSEQAGRRWSPLNQEAVKEILEKSQKRVESNKEFKKIQDELKEQEDRVIRVAEILKNGNQKDSEEKKKEDSEKKDEEEDELSLAEKELEDLPHFDEAFQILIDLVEFSEKQLVANTKTSS